LEEFNSIANSGKSPPTKFFRLSPDHRAFLLENFPAFFSSCSEETSDSTFIIRTILRVSDLSEVPCSSTTSTVSIGAISNVDILDSAHPNWRANIQSFARETILPELLNPRFDSSKFEKLLDTKLLMSTLPFTAWKYQQMSNAVDIPSDFIIKRYISTFHESRELIAPRDTIEGTVSFVAAQDLDDYKSIYGEEGYKIPEYKSVYD
jgi:hypothetical protein